MVELSEEILKPDYRVVEVTLDTVKTDHRIPVGTRYVFLISTPVDITVKIGDKSKQPLNFGLLKSLDAGEGKKISDLFLSWTTTSSTKAYLVLSNEAFLTFGGSSQIVSLATSLGVEYDARQIVDSDGDEVDVIASNSALKTMLYDNNNRYVQFGYAEGEGVGNGTYQLRTQAFNRFFNGSTWDRVYNSQGLSNAFSVDGVGTTLKTDKVIGAKLTASIQIDTGSSGQGRYLIEGSNDGTTWFAITVEKAFDVDLQPPILYSGAIPLYVRLRVKDLVTLTVTGRLEVN